MKNKKRIVIYTLFLIIILILLLPKLNLLNSNKKTTSDPAEISAVPVEVQVLKPKPVDDKIYTNGTIIGNEEVELRSEISGKITQILFEEGKRVKKGELLIKINDADLQATLAKNNSRLDLAKDKEFRLRQMLEKNLTSQQEYDAALSELKGVQADIDYTKALIDKTEIKAPFDGIIGLRSVSIGSYISPQTKIASIQSLNPIKIEFSVPQKYYSEIKEGKLIEFKLQTTGKSYTGKIYAIEPKIDQNTRTLLVRAVANNNDYELLPGAYVEVTVILNQIKNALMIPTQALVPDIQGEKVYLYKNGKALSHTVTSGIRTDKEVQLISGVSAGDTVITSGIIQLRPEIPVKITAIN
ncbi:efflux RND transporter periplasmic adaptor subunit [Melioribacteraceae bacterium 4301-Me]|uniref:efflux RND transporter periplasmic adaptor subunit n=1 Tax=Pyranulibacter aquaticus TaxID=3163344 RepID=UPI003596E4A8